MIDVPQSLEENVLTLLCWSDQHAGIVLARITKASQSMKPLLVQGRNELQVRNFDLFSTRSYKRIARIAIEYNEKYHKPPRAHLRDLMEDLLRRGDEGRLLDQILSAMDRARTDIQADFVLSELDLFIRKQTLSLVIDNVSTSLDSGHIDEAEQVYRQHMSFQAGDSDPGAWLHDPVRMLDFLDRTDKTYFSSGVDVLDDRRCRPQIGQLFAVMAPPKTGKSTWLRAIGKYGIMHGRSVLHISLENSEDETKQGYIQALFGMTRDEEAEQSIRVPMFKRDATGYGISLNHRVINAEAIGPKTRKDVAEKLKYFKSRAPLLIKYFPSGSLTMNQLEMYLDQIDRDYKFRPEMMIIDYPFLMRIDPARIRTDLGRIGVGLRGLAETRNCAMIVAANGNRTSANARTMTRQHVAEDWSLIMTADTVCTLSRTPEEKAANLARVFVDGCRGAPDGYIALITQSYATGQFCLDSAYMDRYLAHEADRMSGAPIEDE